MQSLTGACSAFAPHPAPQSALPWNCSENCRKDTGENTGDPGQNPAVIGSSGEAHGTRINTGFAAIQSQPQSMAEIACLATLNRQVVGSIPTASTNSNQQLSGTDQLLKPHKTPCALALKARKEKTGKRTADLRPVVRTIQNEGATSVRLAGARDGLLQAVEEA